MRAPSSLSRRIATLPANGPAEPTRSRGKSGSLAAPQSIAPTPRSRSESRHRQPLAERLAALALGLPVAASFTAAFLASSPLAATERPIDDPPAAVAPDEPLTSEFDALLARLGSDDFDEREQATEQLWRAGRAAEPALRRALGDPDREIAFRASRILERFRLGIFADTPPEKIRLIRSYVEATDQQRLLLIRSLVQEGEVDDLLLLLDRETDAGRRQQGESLVMGQLEPLVLPLLEQQDQARVDRLLDRFALNPISQYLQVSVAAMQGPEAIAALIERAASLASANDPGRGKRIELMSLAMLGDLDAALAIAAQLPDPQEARGWRSSLLVIDGRWRDYLEHLTGSAEPPDGALPGSLAGNELLLARWGAHMAQDEAWSRRLDEAIETQFSDDSQLLPRVQIELLLGDVDAALERTRRLDPLLHFSILVAQDRFVEAYTQSGIGATRDERAAWYESLLNELKQAGDETPEGGQTAFDEARLKLAVEAAGWLVALGEIEEGSELLTRIWQTLPMRLASRRMHQGRILDLEFRNELDDAFVRHGIELYSLAQFQQALAEVDRNRGMGGAFVGWWAMLESERLEPAERLRAIRDLLSLPRQNPEQVERRHARIEKAIAEFGGRTLDQQASPGIDLHLAEACFANDLEARGEQLLREAIERNSDLEARTMLVEHLRQRERWDEVLAAIEGYRQDLAPAMRGFRNLDGQGLACERIRALFELGRDAEAREELGRLQQISYASQLSAGRALDDVELDDAARDALRRIRFAPLGQPTRFAGMTYQSCLALALIMNDSVGSADPRDIASLSASMLALDRPMFLEPSLRDAPQVVFLMQFVEMAEQAAARERLAAGDLDGATAYLRRALAIRPGNVDNLLDFVEPLEAAGGGATIAELHATCRATYREQIEAFPRSAMHRNNLAWMSARSGLELDEALEMATAAVAARPTEDNYVDTLAEVRFRRGEFAQAVAEAQRCVAMTPSNVHYRQQLERFRRALAEAEAGR